MGSCGTAEAVPLSETEFFIILGSPIMTMELS